MLLFISVSVTAPFASAQTNRISTVTGTVIDAYTNQPLPGAGIYIDSTKYMGTAGADGKFSITNVPRQSVMIEVEFLGYETYSQKNVLIGGTTFNAGTIRLTPTATNIEELVVSAEAIMATQKGDTVQYNAEAFKVNPDADASDLLAKMPGMSVEGGTVTAQGETVRRVYVDNKLLFGDDAMTALTNLPGEVVESIQWFDEQTDEARFSGYDDGQRQRALNIVTTRKGNRATTARVEAGYGTSIDNADVDDFKNRFMTNISANTFSDKNSIMIGLNSANVGGNSRGGGGGGFGGGGGGGGGLFTARAATIGFNQTWRSDRKLSLGYSYSDNQNVRNTVTWQDWNPIPSQHQESRLYQDSTYSKNNSYNHTFFGRFEYVFNTTNRIFFTPTLSFNNSRSHSIRDNYDDKYFDSGDTTRIYQITHSTPTSEGNGLSAGGNAIYTHVFQKPGRSISANVSYNFTKNTSDDEQESKVNSLYESITNGTTYSYKPTNDKTPIDNWTKRLNTRISYGEPLAANQRIEISYRFQYIDGQSDRKVYDLIADPDGGILDLTQTNTYLRKDYQNIFGLGYNLSTDKDRISIGLEANATHMIADQVFPALGTDGRNFLTWEPRVMYNRQITRQKYFRINYSSSTDVHSVTDYQNVINSNNKTNLTAGNPNLKPEVRHNVQIRYNAANIERSSSFSVEGNISMRFNGVGNKTTLYMAEEILHDYNDYKIESGYQLTTPVNLNGYFNGSLRATYSLPWKLIKSNINFGGAYTFSRLPSYSGKDLNYASTNGATLTLGVNSNISQNVDFSVTSNTSLRFVDNSSSTTSSKNLTETIRANVNIIFLGGVVFNANGNYYYNYATSSSASTTEYFTLNAGLGYKFLRKRNAEFRLTVYDILNQTKNYSYTINDRYIQQQWNYIIGRYAMLTFSYRFNSMNTSTGRSDVPRPQGGDRNARPAGGGDYRGGPQQGGPPMMMIQGGGGGGGRF